MRLSPWAGPGWWLGALALVVSLTVVGCGGRGKGTVTGKVTYKGAPLKGGKVAFAAANKQNVIAEIEQDGSYTADDVPAGPAKVTVLTSYLKQASRAPRYQPPKDAKVPEGYKMGGDPNDAKRYVKIPDNYEDPDQSGLNLDVKSGPQPFNIDLK
jgi:hypothetical protein